MNLQDMKWRLKGRLSQNRVGFAFLRFLRGNSGNFVGPKTDLVLEGFPRSGNTYLVALVTLKSTRPICIARHRHELGQLRRAVDLGKPTFVLMRDPLNSVVSFVIRERVSLKFALEYYIEFYRFCDSLGKKILIVDFDDLVKNPGTVLRNMRQRFERLQLKEYQPEDEMAVSELVRQMEINDSGGIVRETHIALPTSERSKAKTELSKVVQTHYFDLLNEALSVREALITRNSLEDTNCS